jgi:alkylation response protein AidB-like acyl-CoA dehydrogenase
MNAERVLIASECIGDGRWFIDRAVNYAKERKLFGRPIGQNQGVQYPIARAYTQIEAGRPDGAQGGGDVRGRHQRGRRGQHGQDAGLGGGVGRPAEMCVQTHWRLRLRRGIRRRAQVREARLYTVAPISTNMILNFVSEHVLGCRARIRRPHDLRSGRTGSSPLNPKSARDGLWINRSSIVSLRSMDRPMRLGLPSKSRGH